MRLISCCSFLVFVAGLITLPLSGQIPVTPAGARADNALQADLQLRLVEANDPQTAGSARTGKRLTIVVTNASGAAVSDAAVVFRLPDSDPTGTFADGTHAFVAYTDQEGRANISDVRWSLTPGIVPIRISATKGTAHAGILVEQTLTARGAAPSPPLEPGVLATAETPSPLAVARPLQQSPAADKLARAADASPQAPSAPPSVTVTSGSPDIHTHSAKKWIVIAAIAVGAGVGIALAMGHSKSSSTPSPSAPSPGSCPTTVCFTTIPVGSMH